METRVKRWGNSLALRIPKSLADQVGLKADSPVNLLLRGRELVISPSLSHSQTLEELLARMNQKNLHAVVDTGPAVGREAW